MFSLEFSNNHVNVLSLIFCGAMWSKLNRQSSPEWSCIGHVYRPSVYTVGLQVDCIQLE